MHTNEKPPQVQGSLEMELGGLEPPTSWVRFQPWRITKHPLLGFAEPIIEVSEALGRGLNRGRFVPIRGLLGTKTGLCPLTGHHLNKT